MKYINSKLDRSMLFPSKCYVLELHYVSYAKDIVFTVVISLTADGPSRLTYSSFRSSSLYGNCEGINFQ